jgi:steroid delta-isomerase-like uncharacterized protein
MSRQEMEALARRFFTEVFEQGNVDAIDEICSQDFIEHEAMPGMPGGREGNKEFFRQWNQGISNTRVDVEDMMVDGDKLVVRFTTHGTHSGEFMGIPATDKSFSMPVIDILRYRDGKFVEHWGVSDVMGVMQQIGLLPSP